MDKMIIKSYSKILRALGILFVVTILLLTMFIMIGAMFKNEKQLAPWGTGFFIVLTNSMEPTFSAGSLIFVSEISADEIRPEDVLTFYASNGRDIVTHRVKKVDNNNNNYIFTTRGDANDADDPPVTYEEVIGRVMFIIPGIGFVSSIFRNATLLGAIVIGVSLIICIHSVLSGTDKNSGAPEAVKKEEQL